MFEIFFFVFVIFNQIFNSRFQRSTRLFMNNINKFQILRFIEIKKIIRIIEKIQKKNEKKISILFC